MSHKIMLQRRWATRALPVEAKPYHALTLTGWKWSLLLNFLGLFLLFTFGWLFMGLAAALNPRFFTLELLAFARMLTLRSFLITVIGIVILHELIHALFFWLFSGSRPQIGFHILYAYAAAPGWAFRKDAFLIIGLAPLFVITLVGLILLPDASITATARIILALTVNAAGAVGDIITALWLLSQPRNCWVVDEGARILLFLPSSNPPV